jgi:hypothetical protein
VREHRFVRRSRDAAIARTFEYENSPRANPALTSGSCSSARATRTFVRAAVMPIPHCQLSQCAVLGKPWRAYASLRSNSATSMRKRYVAAVRWPQSSVISASRRSSASGVARAPSRGAVGLAG